MSFGMAELKRRRIKPELPWEDVIEFRGPAHGRRPTLVLGPVSEQGGDRRVQDQNKRNTPAGFPHAEASHPTEALSSDTGFPIYLPTLRQRMASRS